MRAGAPAVAPTEAAAAATDVGNQEATYLNAIQSAVSFEATLDTLILRDGFGQEVARFTRVG